MDSLNLSDLIPEQVKEIKAIIPSEFKFIGSFKKKPGHQLFSFNMKTLDLKIIEPEKELIFDCETGKETVKSKVIQEKDCYYFSALNMKNAIRKIVKKFKK